MIHFQRPVERLRDDTNKVFFISSEADAKKTLLRVYFSRYVISMTYGSLRQSAGYDFASMDVQIAGYHANRGMFGDDLAGWTVVESGRTASPGTVVEDASGLVLSEGDSFLVSLEREVTIPEDAGRLTFEYLASFGFRWMKMEGAQNLRDRVLKHDEASYVFFPWQALWNIVWSGGNQFTKAEGAWMRILVQVDSVYGLPSGWHPAIDVLRGDAEFIPAKVVSELRTLYDRSDRFFELLELWPYEWGHETDWDQVCNWLKSKQRELD